MLFSVSLKRAYLDGAFPPEFAVRLGHARCATRHVELEMLPSWGKIGSENVAGGRVVRLPKPVSAQLGVDSAFYEGEGMLCSVRGLGDGWRLRGRIPEERGESLN